MRLNEQFNQIIGEGAQFRIRTIEDRQRVARSLRIRLAEAARSANHELGAILSQAKEYFKSQSAKLCSCGQFKNKTGLTCRVCYQGRRHKKRLIQISA